MRATQFVTELFDPKSIEELDPTMNVKQLMADQNMWMWQFEIPDKEGKPVPFCFRATNLHHGYYMDIPLGKCWFINLIQADCSKPISMDAETLSLMGDLGNMGRNSIKVFSVCGSLIADLLNKTGAKGLVFNSEPGRTKLYSLFANTIQRKTKWMYAKRSGSFIMEQTFYFFAADEGTMKYMLKTFKKLGQID